MIAISCLFIIFAHGSSVIHGSTHDMETATLQEIIDELSSQMKALKQRSLSNRKLIPSKLRMADDLIIAAKLSWYSAESKDGILIQKVSDFERELADLQKPIIADKVPSAIPGNAEEVALVSAEEDIRIVKSGPKPEVVEDSLRIKAVAAEMKKANEIPPMPKGDIAPLSSSQLKRLKGKLFSDIEKVLQFLRDGNVDSAMESFQHVTEEIAPFRLLKNKLYNDLIEKYNDAYRKLEAPRRVFGGELAMQKKVNHFRSYIHQFLDLILKQNAIEKAKIIAKNACQFRDTLYKSWLNSEQFEEFKLISSHLDTLLLLEF